MNKNFKIMSYIICIIIIGGLSGYISIQEWDNLSKFFSVGGLSIIGIIVLPYISFLFKKNENKKIIAVENLEFYLKYIDKVYWDSLNINEKRRRMMSPDPMFKVLTEQEINSLYIDSTKYIYNLDIKNDFLKADKLDEYYLNQKRKLNLKQCLKIIKFKPLDMPTTYNELKKWLDDITNYCKKIKIDLLKQKEKLNEI